MPGNAGCFIECISHTLAQSAPNLHKIANPASLNVGRGFCTFFNEDTI